MHAHWLLLSVAFLLVVQGSRGLKCRSGNQQTDAKFEKATQLCKRRQGTNHSSRFSDEDSADASIGSVESADSRDDVLDKKLLLGRNNRQGRNATAELNERRWRNAPATGKGRRNENGRSHQSRGTDREFRNRGSGLAGDRKREDTRNANEEDCLMQCIFNELNIVDQHGYPERDGLIRTMSQNVQDPEMKDFLEEAVVECFLYVESEGKRRKCQFSEKLLECLVEKGKERCEDW